MRVKGGSGTIMSRVPCFNLNASEALRVWNSTLDNASCILHAAEKMDYKIAVKI